MSEIDMVPSSLDLTLSQGGRHASKIETHVNATVVGITKRRYVVPKPHKPHLGFGGSFPKVTFDLRAAESRGVNWAIGVEMPVVCTWQRKLLVLRPAAVGTLHVRLGS